MPVLACRRSARISANDDAKSDDDDDNKVSVLEAILGRQVGQREAVCCSVLQCVAVCCSVLQCVAVCRSVSQSCSVLQTIQPCSNLYKKARGSVLKCCAVYLQCITAVCCSALQCVCSVLQQCVAVRCSVFAVCCNLYTPVQTCGRKRVA